MTTKNTTRLALVGMLAGALGLGGTALAQSTSSTGSVQSTPPGGSAGQAGQMGTGSGTSQGTGTDSLQNGQALPPATDSLGTPGTGGSGTGDLPQAGDALDPSRGTGGNTTLSPGTTEPGNMGQGATGQGTTGQGTTQPAPLTPDSNWGGTGGSGSDLGTGSGTQDDSMVTPGQGTIETTPPSRQSDLNSNQAGQVNPGTTPDTTR